MHPELSDRHIAENVKNLRAIRCWSARELAERVTFAGAPMTEDTVYKIEGGRRRAVQGMELLALATVFGVTPEDLALTPEKRPGYASVILRQMRTTQADHVHDLQRIVSEQEAMATRVILWLEDRPEMARALLGVGFPGGELSKLRAVVQSFPVPAGTGQLTKLHEAFGFDNSGWPIDE